MPRAKAFRDTRARKRSAAVRRYLLEPLEGRLLLAAQGDLDPTFGAGGKTIATSVTPSIIPPPAPYVQQQSTGKTLVGYETVDFIDSNAASVARFNSDGSLDGTFGTGGVANYREAKGNLLLGMIVQDDDKVLILSLVAYDLGDPDFPDGDSFLRLIRFTASGQIDTSFGEGDGEIDIPSDIAINELATFVVRPGGSIVVAGPSSQSPGVVAAVAFSVDGLQATSYGNTGSAGVALISVGGPFSSLEIAPENGGGDTAGGGILVGVGGSFTQLTRVNSDGTVDGSFSDGSALAPPGLSPTLAAVKTREDGFTYMKLVSVGEPGPTQLIRFDSDGVLDNGFGNEGVATITNEGGGVGFAFAADGSILSTDETPGGGPTDVVVTRLTPGGAIDNTFGGGDGQAVVNFSDVDENAGRVAVQSDGRILVSAVAAIGPPDFVPAIARLVVDDSPPIVSITPPVIFVGSATTDFQVTYTDDEAIDPASIAAGDVTVTGPGGAALPVTLQNRQPQGTGVLTTWRIAAPGGAWDAADQGSYTVASVLGGISDTSGNTTDSATTPFSFQPPVVGADGDVGGLDPDFGTGGVKSLNPPGPGLKTRDVVTLEDGSTVAAAFTNVAAGSADVTLFKTDENGDLVPGFGGAGNGLVTLDIFGGDDRANAILLLSSGKFLVAGTTSRYDINGVETDADFFVARFNADGTLDTTFGVVNSGFGIADFGSAKLDRAKDVALLDDGRIFVFGTTNAADPDGDFAFARFNAEGIYDTSFGFGGRMTTDLGGADVANAVVLAPDGRFVAAGTTATGNTGTFAVVGYNADGSVATSFGGSNTGSILIDFLPGLDEARSIAAQDNGKLVIGGLASTGAPDDAGFDAQFALARLNADGTLDGGFGSGGKVLTDFSGLAAINKVVAQPGGKILTSGLIVSSLATVGSENVRAALARYNADGSLDSNFSQDGKLVIDFNAGTISGVGAFNSTGTGTLAVANLTALEEQFEQFRQETQGLVSLVKGGAILALATQADNVVLALIVGDAGAPTLFVTLPANVTEIDVTSLLFLVRVVDDLGVDVSTFDNTDLRVTGPNGFSQLAEFVELVGDTGNGLERTARYRLDAPGEEFLKSNDGTYSMSVEANGIADVSGNFIQAAPISGASFTVTVPENLANLRVDGGLTGTFPAAVVGGSKARGGTVRVTNDGTIDAKAVLVVTLYASSDNAFDETADTAVTTIQNVKVSLKPGKSKALRLKFTQYPGTLPDGDYYLIARIDSTNGLPELKESDNSAPTLAPLNIAAPFVDLSATPGAIRGTLAPGAKVTASAFVRNGGNVALKQSVPVTLLASPGDQTVGNGDVSLIGPTLKLNLKPAANKSSRIPVALPVTGLAPGNYFLIAVLDQANATAESDETNNLVVLGTFTVS